MSHCTLIYTDENQHMSENGIFELASAEEPSSTQKLFLRYFTAILIDLVVLNLFAEYWHQVMIASFSISLAVALLLQVLLKITLKIEHKTADYFSSKPGKMAKFLRYFSAWLILFISKLVILAAINFAFGNDVAFGGPLHGVIAFIVVVVVMLVSEEAIVRFYQRLA
jgi:hypothetical protein